LKEIQPLKKIVEFNRRTFVMLRIWKSFAVLVAVLAALPLSAAGVNDVSNKPSGVDLISVEELKAKFITNEPLIIIDVRGSESYANSDSKIKGAIHINVRRLKFRLGFAPLKDAPKDRTVVTYCACPSEEASIKAAQILLESGFKRVRALKGGWQEWQKAAGPTEPRPR
jgi:rhodanese-related sulfurtransferase